MRLFAPMFLGLAVSIAATLAALPASAGNFPSRAITMVVPFTAGGPTDTLARIVAKSMQTSLGQPIVVENKPGAGGNIGTVEVVRKPADGYTILFGSSGPLFINTTLYKKAGFDPLKDFTPIALIGEMPNVMVVKASFGPSNLRDFVTYAKSQHLTYASSGSGSTNHIIGFMLDKQVGGKMVHVPYRGTSPAVNDLIGDHVSFMILDVLTAVPFIEGGTLKALGMPGLSRSALLPDVPTFQEQGMPPINLGLGFGIVGPRGMDDAVLSKLDSAIQAALSSPEVSSLMARQGVEAAKNSNPKSFSNYIAREVGRWRDVVLQTGAVAD